MTLRTALVPAALFAATTAICGAVVWQAERLWAAGQREAASQAAAGAAFALEQQVSRSLSATYSLAALVHHDPQLRDFERLAGELLPLHGAVSSLQLAPDAVIQRIYPLPGNEPALGHDLLNDPDRRLQAKEAVASRRLTVAGPFELKQGGLGLVGRLAVFLPAPGAPGGERFWGLVTAVIRVPALLEEARLRRLDEAGYHHRLTRLDPEHDVRVCFDGCEVPLAPDPVSFDISVPNGAWTLSVAPADGWPAAAWRTPAWLLVLAAAAALSLLARQVLRQPELLQREVASRTAELASAHAALAEELARLRAAESAAHAAEEQLRQAQKMDAVGQLAGGIAHDFNNLLTGILGHAAVLLDESPPGSDAHEAAATIAAAARRAAELTRQLLQFSRRRPLAAVPFDAHEVLAQVIRLLGRTLDPRIRLDQRLAAPRAVVTGDPGQLEQAVLNLAVNARDAMPEGGVLRFETEVVRRDDAWAARHSGAVPGEHLAIRVADTGHGITPAVRERMFEPFFTTKAPGSGTGLGLASVYAIARAHGGGVDVESEPGRGARFTLSVLLAPEGVSARRDATGPGSGPAAGAGRVLVVDDDPVPRGATSALLRAAGYEVLETGSGEEGLRRFEAQPAAVRAVVLDVAMPGMDGVSCFEALRRVAPDVPVLFVSGHARDARAEALAARGEAGFLAKPFDREELVRALEAAARNRA
jgi:signal transduction histidine kinase/CheY-like chemotaxis protein